MEFSPEEQERAQKLLDRFSADATTFALPFLVVFVWAKVLPRLRVGNFAKRSWLLERDPEEVRNAQRTLASDRTHAARPEATEAYDPHFLCVHLAAKLTYIESHKAIELANYIFRFNGALSSPAPSQCTRRHSPPSIMRAIPLLNRMVVFGDGCHSRLRNLFATVPLSPALG